MAKGALARACWSRFITARLAVVMKRLQQARAKAPFATGGDAANGQCADFHGGFLPGAALGLAGLDAEGFVRDAWLGPANRIRYAVFGDGAAINGVVNPLTRANGMQAATLAGLGAAPHLSLIHI